MWGLHSAKGLMSWRPADHVRLNIILTVSTPRTLSLSTNASSVAAREYFAALQLLLTGPLLVWLSLTITSPAFIILVSRSKAAPSAQVCKLDRSISLNCDHAVSLMASALRAFFCQSNAFVKHNRFIAYHPVFHLFMLSGKAASQNAMTYSRWPLTCAGNTALQSLVHDLGGFDNPQPRLRNLLLPEVLELLHHLRPVT